METVVRVFVVYLFVLIGMRVIGKREFGQLAPHEFVILMMIPEIFSPAVNLQDTTLTNAFIGVATIFVLVFLTSLFTHVSPTVQRLVSDSETVLVHKGKLYETALDKERVTPDEILAEARKSGVDSIEDIRWAILESEGEISIVPEHGPSHRRSEHSAK